MPDSDEDARRELEELEAEVRRLIRLVPPSAEETFERDEEGFVAEHRATPALLAWRPGGWIPAAYQYPATVRALRRVELDAQNKEASDG